MALVEDLGSVVDNLAADSQRLLVSIDGPDAAGKTTLARGLASTLQTPVVMVSVDSWHRRREIRWRRGEMSPDGYYRDSFDYDVLRKGLFVPGQAFYRGEADRRA